LLVGIELRPAQGASSFAPVGSHPTRTADCYCGAIDMTITGSNGDGLPSRDPYDAAVLRRVLSTLDQLPTANAVVRLIGPAVLTGHERRSLAALVLVLGESANVDPVVRTVLWGAVEALTRASAESTRVCAASSANHLQYFCSGAHGGSSPQNEEAKRV
jgi:hypothetical protein